MMIILDKIFNWLNSSSYFLGLMMILLNIGSKYLMIEFGSIIDYVFNIKFIRRLMLFTVFFVATRNVKTSIVLTGIFIVLSFELFNDKSNNCIIPPTWLKYMENESKQKNSKTEIQHALSILKQNGFIH
jgi:hypothetical protein